MMLVVQNPDSDNAFELAMLLDEPPSPSYMPGAIYGQPARANSPLATAYRTAQQRAFAWLYIVFKSDKPLFWGKRRIKVTAARKLYLPLRSKLGLETGEVREVAYKVVAPEVFHVAHGEVAHDLEYKVVTSARLEIDPESRVPAGECHPLLGYVERPLPDVPKEPQDMFFVHPDVGCRVEWWNKSADGAKNEMWFLQDSDGLEDNRFELTEFLRRPFVRIVLLALGFVKPADENDLQYHSDSAQLDELQCTELIKDAARNLELVADIMQRYNSTEEAPSAARRRMQFDGRQPEVIDLDGGGGEAKAPKRLVETIERSGRAPRAVERVEVVERSGCAPQAQPPVVPARAGGSGKLRVKLNKLSALDRSEIELASRQRKQRAAAAAEASRSAAHAPAQPPLHADIGGLRLDGARDDEPMTDLTPLGLSRKDRAMLADKARADAEAEKRRRARDERAAQEAAERKAREERAAQAVEKKARDERAAQEAAERKAGEERAAQAAAEKKARDERTAQEAAMLAYGNLGGFQLPEGYQAEEEEVSGSGSSGSGDEMEVDDDSSTVAGSGERGVTKIEVDE